MQDRYTFHSDPSHGWIEVPVADLQELGVSLDKISNYSYVSNDTLFLEEDCDAGVFLEAFRAKHKRDPEITFKDTNDQSFVRRLSSVADYRSAA